MTPVPLALSEAARHSGAMRSLRERVIHTVLFEVIAIAVSTPVIGLVTGASAADSGLLSLLIALGAVAANAGWTFAFDRWVPTRRRGLGLRALHAAGLELLIAAYTIPLTMLITGATLTAALALDAGAIVFFLVYSLAYNAAFDAVMLRLEARQAQALSR